MPLLLGDDKALSAEQQFSAAEALFESRDYKGTKKALKRIRGANEELQARVKRLLLAAEGGLKLGKIEKFTRDGKWKKGWVELQKLRKKYGATPLLDRLEEFELSISPMLFYYVATFEEPTIEPEKSLYPLPSRREINTDLKFVRKGKRSLQWEPEYPYEEGAYQRLAKVDGAVLASCSKICLSIYNASRTDDGIVTFDLVLARDVSSLRKKGMEFVGDGYVYWVYAGERGWNDFVIDMSDLKKSGEVKPEDVKEMGVIVRTCSGDKLFIDEVFFVYRRPGKKR